MSDKEDDTRCGFVAVIGAPNAGKSTLINSLVGSKVSIVSPKVQTTRTLVRGIAIHEHAQIILVDTPGIFAPKKKLERAMVSAAWEGAGEADIIMLIIDAARGKIDADSAALIETLKQKNPAIKKILVLNKIDKAPRESLLALSAALNEEIAFDATFMVSALKQDGIQDILVYLAAHLPRGPWHFPEDEVSDMPLRLLAAEILREKLFRKLHKELPYNLTVETEDWEEFEDGSVKISQIVFVARESHKKIVLGKGGALIKNAGQEARHELADMLGRRVHLKTHVKCRENWTDDPERYRIWGLDHSA